VSDETVFAVAGDVWTPVPYAGGFNGPGMHGGAVGAMLTGACERHAAERDENTVRPLLPLMTSVLLLRPVPLGPIEVRVETLRSGSRGLFLRAEAWAEDKLQVTAQVAFARSVTTPGMPEPEFLPMDPAGGNPGVLASPGEPWLGDLVEMRLTADKLCWIRYDRPLFEGETPLALAASVADWSSGMWRPDGWRAPKAKWFPNVELGVRVARPPSGPWIGFRNRQHWRQNGLGTTETELFDRHGAFGGASQSLLLTPLDGPDSRALGLPTEQIA
jgi:hypothetical protein